MSATEQELLRRIQDLERKLEDSESNVLSIARALDSRGFEVRNLRAENHRLSVALEETLEEAGRFHDAIAKHYDSTEGHNMCWENDVKLWEAIGIVAEHPEPPPWCEFMQKCAEYRASREKEQSDGSQSA